MEKQKQTTPQEPASEGYQPAKMTTAQSVTMTIKILVVIGAIIAVVWFLDRGI